MKRSISIQYENGDHVTLEWDPKIIPSFLGYWDCDCGSDENYIHPDSDLFCPACGATSEHSPNARVEEFVEKLLRKVFYDTMDNGTHVPTFSSNEMNLIVRKGTKEP